MQLKSLVKGKPISLESGAVERLQEPLQPKEIEVCNAYGESRKREFIAGRTLARRALARLGHGAGPILKAESGAPVWPSGTTGSISHSGGHCVAATASARDVGALGIDIQEVIEIDSEFARTVMRADDRHKTHETIIGVSVALVYFSIRESVYKAYNPHTLTFLEFEDVAVDLDFDTNTFEAKIGLHKPPLICGRRVLSGRIQVTQDVVAALAWVVAE